MKRYHRCFRCKTLKIVGEEIARADMHAVCYSCLGAKSHHSSTPQTSGHAVQVRVKRVKKTPGNHNRSLPTKPTE